MGSQSYYKSLCTSRLLRKSKLHFRYAYLSRGLRGREINVSYN